VCERERERQHVFPTISDEITFDSHISPDSLIPHRYSTQMYNSDEYFPYMYPPDMYHIPYSTCVYNSDEYFPYTFLTDMYYIPYSI